MRSRRMLVAGAAAITLLSACGGGDGDASDQTITVPEGIGDDDEATTTTKDPKAPCTAEALTEATAGEYAGSTISRETCASGVAVALISGDAVGGESVAFFEDQDGRWVLITVGPIEAATADTLPEEFPDIVFTRWLNAEKQSTAPPEEAVGSEGGGGGSGDSSDEYTRPSIYDNTTTTVPPTTAPPTTAPLVLDPYCIEFPEEPSCIENPYLPQ